MVYVSVCACAAGLVCWVLQLSQSGAVTVVPISAMDGTHVEYLVGCFWRACVRQYRDAQCVCVCVFDRLLRMQSQCAASHLTNLTSVCYAPPCMSVKQALIVVHVKQRCPCRNIGRVYQTQGCVGDTNMA
jgi:hypothetical protein